MTYTVFLYLNDISYFEMSWKLIRILCNFLEYSLFNFLNFNTPSYRTFCLIINLLIISFITIQNGHNHAYELALLSKTITYIIVPNIFSKFRQDFCWILNHICVAQTDCLLIIITTKCSTFFIVHDIDFEEYHSLFFSISHIYFSFEASLIFIFYYIREGKGRGCYTTDGV